MIRQIFLFITLSISTGLYAQSFVIETSSDSVLVGNYIIISFTAENLDGQFEAPDFDGMQVLSGPNVSNSIQIINGDKSTKATYTYHVQPPDVGIYTISPAYIVDEESTLETIPLVINVYPNPENIITPPKSSANEFFFNFDQFSPFGNRDDIHKVPTPPIPPKKPKRKYKRI